MAVDRTMEFNACAESAHAKQKHKRKVRVDFKSPKMQFTQHAHQLDADIFQTFNRLSRLTALVKTIQNLFEDPTAQIEDLTHVIKQDICHLNLQIKFLKELSQAQNFHGQQNVHSQAVVANLNGKIGRLTKELGDTIDLWVKGVKTRKTKMQRITSVPANIVSMPLPSHLSGFSPTSHLPEYNSSNGGQLVIAMPGLPITQEYTASRASAIEMLEGPLHDLQSVFTQLLHLVAKQDDDIKRIDYNIDTVSIHVDKGQNELLKHITLIVKLFGTVIVFVIIFVFLIL